MTQAEQWRKLQRQFFPLVRHDIRIDGFKPDLATPQGQAAAIHEVCHRVSANHHGRRWIARMEHAAKTADDKGLTRLATLIRSDINRHSGLAPERPTASKIYERIGILVQDWYTRNEGCFPPYRLVVEAIRNELGITARAFDRRYQLAHRWYRRFVPEPWKPKESFSTGISKHDSIYARGKATGEPHPWSYKERKKLKVFEDSRYAEKREKYLLKRMEETTRREERLKEEKLGISPWTDLVKIKDD